MSRLQQIIILVLLLVIGLILSYLSGNTIGIVVRRSTSLIGLVQTIYVSALVLMLARSAGLVRFVWPPRS